MESFMVTNLDGDPQEFADVIAAWRDVYAGEMSVRQGRFSGIHRTFQARIRRPYLCGASSKGLRRLAHLGSVRAKTAMMTAPIRKPRLGLRSFRAKFMIVVGGAVLFDLLVSGGLALWNVQRLSRDATAEVGHGLERASQDYIRSYTDSTAAQVGLLLHQVHSDVKALTGVLQGQIDQPTRNGEIGAAMARAAPDAVTVTFDAKGQWAPEPSRGAVGRQRMGLPPGQGSPSAAAGADRYRDECGP